MRHTTRRRLILIFVLGAALVVAVFWVKAKARPQLSLSFLGYTNEPGGRCAVFAVTNSGTASAVSYGIGHLDIDGQTPVLVAYRSSFHRLAAGKADVLRVIMPPSLEGRWRFKCEYAQDGIRSRLYDWSWQPNGPGARANYVIPEFLRGVPVDVIATSGWIDRFEK